MKGGKMGREADEENHREVDKKRVVKEKG